MFCMLKKKKYILLAFPKTTQIMKNIIFLMISNREKLWHYLAVKRLSALLRGIDSKHHGDFYCLNCLYSFATKKRESHKKLCENKDFCNFMMSSKDTKILEFDQCQKSDKALLTFYAYFLDLGIYNRKE